MNSIRYEDLCFSSLVLFGILIYLYYMSDASVDVSCQLSDYIVFGFLNVSLYLIMYFQ